jgi:transposase
MAQERKRRRFTAEYKAEAAELVRLKRENKRLEQENEILKRAAAFFAREAVPS